MCAMTARKIYANSPRKTLLSVSELENLEIGSSPCEMRVNLMGRSSVKFRVYSHSMIEEITSYIFIKLGLRSRPKWGLYININNVLVPFSTNGYIHDELNSIYSYFCPKQKINQSSENANQVILFKKIAFGNEYPELINVVFSYSIMLQIIESLWYNSIFLDLKLCMELTALFMAYEANDTKISLSNEDQFMQKLKSRLSSKLLSKFSDCDSKDAFNIYQSNRHVQKELIMRKFLNLSLVKNNVCSLLYYGIYKETNEPCILSISCMGISIVSCKDRKIISTIKSSSILYYEGEDDILKINSIVGDVNINSETISTPKSETIKIYKAKLVADTLGSLVSKFDESINLLRRVYNFGDEELLNDLVKAKEALVKNGVVRSTTIYEEKKFEQFIDIAKRDVQPKSGVYTIWRNALSVSRKNTNVSTNNVYSSCIQNQENDKLSSEHANPKYLIWIYYPMELKIPLTIGRVPPTWSSELWNFLNSLENEVEWLDSVKNMFLSLCIGAPQIYVDEFYIMLSKATSGPYINKNISKKSHLYRLWTVFCLGIYYFGPSPDIYDYVHAHVRASCKSYMNKKEQSLKRLILLVNQCRKNLLSNPSRPRKHSPSTTELSYVLTIHSVAIVVRSFSMEDPYLVKIKPLTIFQKLAELVLERFSIRGLSYVNYALYFVDDQGLRMCDPNEYVCDSLPVNNVGIDDYKKEYLQIRRICQKVYLEKMFSGIEKYYYIIQIISDVCNGFLPTPTVVDFAKVAAHLVQYNNGDYSLSTPDSVYSQAFEKYIPPSLKNNNSITISHVKEWHMALTRVTAQSVIFKLDSMLSKWKLHNSLIFKVVLQEDDSDIDKSCAIALTPTEILINPSPDGIDHDGRIPLCDINNVFEIENGVIVVCSGTGIQRAVFKTNRHSELTMLIKNILESQ